MNILFVAREIPYPPNSGGRMRVWNVLAQLAHDHDLKLICYGRLEDVCNEVKQVCSEIFLIDPLEQPKGIALLAQVFFGLFSRYPYAVSSRFSRQMKQKVKRIIADGSTDLIMCDSLYLALHVPFGNIKTVLNEHNIESIIIARYARVETNLLKKIYAFYELKRMKGFENNIWAKFNQCYVCSSVDQNEIINRAHHSDVVVIPNGIDVNEYYYPQQVERKSFSLMYTGLIGWKPNEDAVLYFAKEIYPLIRKEILDVTFTIVGKDPSKEVQLLAQKDPSITVTGFVDAIKPYILKTEVVIVPLRIGSGTRLKILESWAMGKAIVSTSIGCEGLEYTDGHDILVADSPELFAEKTIELLKNQKLKKTLENNGRQLVEEKYSWKVIGDMIKQVIEKI